MKKLILVALLTAIAACGSKKNKDAPAPSGSSSTDSGSAVAPPPAPPPPPPAGSGSDAAGSGSAAAEPPAAAADADSIEIHAEHSDPKNPNPVTLKFETFKVTKATFDSKNLEGGTATIELDIASLKSDSAKRDGHVKSKDYLDAAAFTTATIEVANVKKKADTTYTADATVKFHGVTKKYPVTFDVVDAKDDWIKIKGEQKFSRLDFKVGKAATDKNEGVAENMTIAVALTLKKT
jgi:polyisoprenoid-binding protein YceI